MPNLNHRIVLDPTGTHCTVPGCGRLASKGDPTQHRRGWDARRTTGGPIALAVAHAPAKDERIDSLLEQIGEARGELGAARSELSRLRGDIRTLIGSVDRLANVVGARQPKSTRRFADGRIRGPRKVAA